MTLVIERKSAGNDLVAERASLHQLLLSALQRQRRVQPLPPWLHADLGLPPSPDREVVRRGR